MSLQGCSRITRKEIHINSLEKCTSTNIEQTPPITIWIHGTLFFSNLFFPTFFYCPSGLTLSTSLEKKYYHRTIAETLSATDPQRFPLETFYLFGWSGALSFEVRKQTAIDLYEALKKLVNEYMQQYGKKPFIRIITHSHAGNVVLNMATIKNTLDDITISELILLACPVQVETAHLSTDPLFKRIYSIFSTLDSIQILDPQGLYPKKHKQKRVPLFSERLFEPQPHIAQVNLKINGHGIMHMGFLFNKFLTTLPFVLQEIDQCFMQQEANKPKEPWFLNIVKTTSKSKK